MASKFNPIQSVENDGLKIMEVGNWSEKKYKLFGRYCDIFTSGMKNKWNLVYIDLFCGPGYVLNRDSKSLMKNASLISMSLPKNFDYYILNDKCPETVEAMSYRIERHHPEENYDIYNLDANTCIKEVMKGIPRFKNDKGILIFCFLDPFSLNLNFDTIRELSRHQVDILILHALQMDAKRNLKYYIAENNHRIAKFTGSPDWKEKLQLLSPNRSDFVKFISDEFDQNIKKLGYLSPDKKEQIRNNSGMGIYHLAFYSKHKRGIEFFQKVKPGHHQQYEMF